MYGHRIDFEFLTTRANKNNSSSAKLGFILEMTKESLLELGKSESYLVLINQITQVLGELKPSATKILWSKQNTRETGSYYEEKWRVVVGFEPEDFKRAILKYVQ